MSLYDQYSEQEYYTKKKLLSLNPGVVGECMYQEIWAIRKLFLMPIEAFNKKQYIIMTKKINELMIHILETKLYKHTYESKVEYRQMEYHHKQDALLRLASELNIYIPYELVQFLYRTNALLLKLYILRVFSHENKLLYFYLKQNDRLEWYEMIIGLNTVEETSVELDLTSSFLSFLVSFYLKICEMMVLSNGDDIQLTYNEIQFRYPQLNENQIHFYLTHNHSQQYYTIQNFKQYTNISYESARKQLDMLMQLKFYNRIKIGKKYVYTTDGCK